MYRLQEEHEENLSELLNTEPEEVEADDDVIEGDEEEGEESDEISE
jgi:hypothetical protein